jgi:amino acid transporter
LPVNDLVLSLVLAVAAGIYISRNEKDLEPPRKRVPRKRWGFYANGTGAIVFLGVAYATWWVWLVVVGVILRAARLIYPIPYLHLRACASRDGLPRRGATAGWERFG